MSKENYIEETRPHDSAYKHVSGYAEYTDHINEPKNTIYFAIGFTILALAEIVVRYSGISWSHTIFYYLFPLGMIPLFYFILIRKFKYENLF